MVNPTKTQPLCKKEIENLVKSMLIEQAGSGGAKGSGGSGGRYWPSSVKLPKIPEPGEELPPGAGRGAVAFFFATWWFCFL